MKSSLLYGVYCVTGVLWLLLVYFSGYTGITEGPIFEFLVKPFLIGMTILPFMGGIAGLLKAKKWGGNKSIVGRALTSLSLGLIAWSGGMIIWNYFLFFTTIEVPYPSIADGLFILSWPLWSYGIWQLARATGVKFALRTMAGKILLCTIPIVTGALSYILLIVVARGGIIQWSSGGIKLFFDLFYPLGDVVIITGVALLYGLSKKFLGGKLKRPIIMLLIGFIFNYVTDFIFSYTTTKETYFNGHMVDILFTTTMFILSLAVNSFDLDSTKS